MGLYVCLAKSVEPGSDEAVEDYTYAGRAPEQLKVPVHLPSYALSAIWAAAFIQSLCLSFLALSCCLEEVPSVTSSSYY